MAKSKVNEDGSILIYDLTDEEIQEMKIAAQKPTSNDDKEKKRDYLEALVSIRTFTGLTTKDKDRLIRKINEISSDALAKWGL